MDHAPEYCSSMQNTIQQSAVWFQLHKKTYTCFKSSHATLFSWTIFPTPYSLITTSTQNTLSLLGNNFLKQIIVTLNPPVQKGAFYQMSHEIHFTFLPLVCQKLYAAFNKLLQMSMLITEQHDISNSEKAENQKQLH